MSKTLTVKCGASGAKVRRDAVKLLAMDDLPHKPLRRSHRNVMIAGVCGGIAEWLGWDPTVVRVLYVLLSIGTVAFPGTVLYAVLWLVMPTE